MRWLPLEGTAPRALAISHTGSGILVATDRCGDSRRRPVGNLVGTDQPTAAAAQHDAHRSGASPALDTTPPQQQLDTTPPQQQLELFSLNGRPMCRVPLRAPLGHLLCTRDGEMVVASEGALVTVRRLHDLQLLHCYPEAASAVPVPPRVCALSLCAENHHTFVGTEDGGLCILANPIVNIQVLEAIAGELLNL